MSKRCIPQQELLNLDMDTRRLFVYLWKDFESEETLNIHKKMEHSESSHALLVQYDFFIFLFYLIGS
jgi:hypothetical protein